MPKGRPKIYNTEEERHEAILKNKRKWANEKRVSPTYQQMISKMTPDEYLSFLEKKRLLTQKYRERKRANNE